MSKSEDPQAATTNWLEVVMERNEERMEVSKGCFLLSHSGRLFPQDTLQKIHSIHKRGKS